MAVYVHKDPAQWLARLEGARIHRADEIDIFALERTFVAQLVSRLERRMAFALSVSDRDVTVALGADLLSGSLKSMQIG